MEFTCVEQGECADSGWQFAPQSHSTFYRIRYSFGEDGQTATCCFYASLMHASWIAFKSDARTYNNCHAAFPTFDAAKAACEHHHATGSWS